MPTFGKTTDGTGSNNGALRAVNVCKYTMADNGYLVKMVGRLSSNSGRTGVVRGCIFSDTAGEPGALFAYGNDITITASLPETWVDLTFGATGLFAPGDYWLGYHFVSVSADPAVVFSRISPEAGSAPWRARVDMADPFGTPSGSAERSMDVYVEYVLTTSVPVIVSSPVVSGLHAVGQTLYASSGAWAGVTPTYAYQWLRSGSSIGGATSASYVVQAADVGYTLSVTVTATNANGAGTPATSAAVSSNYSLWHPALKQDDETDTIWLFDPVDEAANWPSGVSGLMDTTGQFTSSATCNPWRVGSPYAVEAGKYRDGVRGSASASGHYLWMPGIHAPSNQFTIEMWSKCSQDWSTQADRNLLVLGTDSIDSGSATTGIQIHVESSGKMLEAVFLNRQVSPTQVSQKITDTRAFLANEEVGVAITYDGTTMTLYRTVGGVTTAVGTKAISEPFGWMGHDRIAGLILLNGGAAGCDKWLLSDLRISRKCRVPGTQLLVPAANTVTITDTPTGATVNPYLRAGVQQPAVGNAVTEAFSADNVSAIRIDKVFDACPSKAGGTDGTHPTLGNSGAYSYDWRPLDHTLDFYAEMGTPFYIGLSNTPQILGGSHAPFTPSQCADVTKLISSSTSNTEMPNNFASFGTMAGDAYHYITVTRGETPLAITFWNEPDITWAGTKTQFYQCYEAVSDAVRAINPSAYIGTGEIASQDAFAAWIAPLVSYCATNTVALDFISFHNYGGDFGFMKYAKTLVDGYVTTYSFGNAIDLWLTEWNWNAALLPLNGLFPIRDRNWVVNDWAASLFATGIIAGQQFGTEGMFFYGNFAVESSATGFNATGLYQSTHPWVGLNVLEMWRRLG